MSKAARPTFSEDQDLEFARPADDDECFPDSPPPVVQIHEASIDGEHWEEVYRGPAEVRGMWTALEFPPSLDPKFTLLRTRIEISPIETALFQDYFEEQDQAESEEEARYSEPTEGPAEHSALTSAEEALHAAHGRLHELSMLAPGWDGDEALPICPQALTIAEVLIDLTIALVEQAPPGAYPPLSIVPSVVPLPCGHILLEWFNKALNLRIEIHEDNQVAIEANLAENEGMPPTQVYIDTRIDDPAMLHDLFGMLMSKFHVGFHIGSMEPAEA